MAGGSGTRLWPASRQNNPKQFHPFLGEKTLLQNTYARLRKGFKANQVFVATTENYASTIKKQLRDIPLPHYSIEPAGRDIGPALGLAALIMNHVDPDSTFVTAWSDHYIQKEKEFHNTLQGAEKIIRLHPDKVLAIGAVPQFPATGFGYIEMGRGLGGNHHISAYHAKSFREKPSSQLAKKYLHSGNFLWNTGYFVFKTRTLLGLYEKHLPEVHRLLTEIKPFLGSKKQQEAIAKFYPRMPKVGFEQPVIMKLNKQLLTMTASFDWIDVGSWRVVKDVLSLPEENLLKGNVVTHNTFSTLVYNYEDKLVSTVGLKNLVVINTEDALLIMNKDDSEQIKEVIGKLKENKKWEKFL